MTPIYLSRNRFYLILSPHCPKMNKNAMWEVKKIKTGIVSKMASPDREDAENDKDNIKSYG